MPDAPKFKSRLQGYAALGQSRFVPLPAPGSPVPHPTAAIKSIDCGALIGNGQLSASIILGLLSDETMRALP
jgi:hypothetical protein